MAVEISQAAATMANERALPMSAAHALHVTYHMHCINLYCPSVALSTTIKLSHHPCNRAIVMSLFTN